MKKLNRKAKVIISMILMLALVVTCFCSCKKKVAEEETTIGTEETTKKEDDDDKPIEEMKIVDNERIKGATLLNVNNIYALSPEQKKCKASEQAIEDGAYVDEDGYCHWWLGTKGLGDGTTDSDTTYVAYIMNLGKEDCTGLPASNDTIGVRPALEFESSDLEVGDKFEFGGYTFTVISDEYALCDVAITAMAFKEDYSEENPNQYSNSDVKKFLDEWYNGIVNEETGEDGEDTDDILTGS